jgi:phosphoribosylanthranilate isomerase
MIGVVFVPSRRQVTPNVARGIAAAAKSGYRRLQAVGLFVNAPLTEVNSIAEECSLDAVQLCGDETWEYCQRISRTVIRAIGLKPGADADALSADIERGLSLVGEERLRILLDAYVEGRRGGTGMQADWNVAARIASRFPVILAGGLTPDNVGEAVRRVRPWGVDVSSGVETAGVKDSDKIRRFVRAVRLEDLALRQESRRREVT